jgi:hypothetical protein
MRKKEMTASFHGSRYVIIDGNRQARFFWWWT